MEREEEGVSILGEQSGAALLKRLLAHPTQLLRRVENSTRKVAMCAHHVLSDLFAVLATERSRGLSAALDGAVEHLAANARRAHPKRDREKGRLQLGFEPVLAGA